jgi:RNA polymerase sigma-70 factor (ECF subfamily)
VRAPDRSALSPGGWVDAAQAQDLTQEVLIEAWKSLHRFNNQCQLATWLCSILLHRHKSARRRARWRSLLLPFAPAEQASELERVRDCAPAPDQAAQLSERSRLILESLDRLPVRQREVVFLRFYAGESLEGIAGALQCSPGTVKSRLFHALENLRRMNLYREELR